jgi:hypothetical protein
MAFQQRGPQFQQPFGGFAPPFSGPRQDVPESTTMLHQTNFPSKVADWRSERYDEKNRAIQMRDDNVEVLSIAVDREFHGAQDLLKEHKFVSGIFVAPGDDEMANLYMRELMNVLAVKVSRTAWLQILRAIVKAQQKEGVELVSPLDYLTKKQQAQKRRQRKRLQEKLQMMGASAEEEVIPTVLLAEDLRDSDDDMDFGLAPPPPPRLPGEGQASTVHLPTMERQYDFSSVVGVRISESGQNGSVIGGRLDENVGPVIKIRCDENGIETEVAWNELGRLMNNTGDYSAELIQEKVAACTRSLFTPPRAIGQPFRTRRGGG